MDEHRALEHELEGLKRKSAGSLMDGVLASKTTIGQVSLIAHRVEGIDPSLLRELAENTGAKIGSGVVVLGVASHGKVSLVASVSADLQKQLHAGRIIKQVAEVGGGSGGGRPDFAQAGGKDAEKLDQALQSVYNIVAGMMG
jgi:alanyl-tRNA synthetase